MVSVARNLMSLLTSINTLVVLGFRFLCDVVSSSVKSTSSALKITVSVLLPVGPLHVRLLHPLHFPHPRGLGVRADGESDREGEIFKGWMVE